MEESGVLVPLDRCANFRMQLPIVKFLSDDGAKGLKSEVTEQSFGGVQGTGFLKQIKDRDDSLQVTFSLGNRFLHALPDQWKLMHGNDCGGEI